MHVSSLQTIQTSQMVNKAVLLKVNFSVVFKTNCQVGEFTVTHLGIPQLICETKQGYRTGEAAQTRFSRSTRTHQHIHTINIIA